MDKYFGIIIFSSFFLLNACVSSASTMENPLQSQPSETLTVLFSDTSTMQKETNYYNALLELQQTYQTDTPSLIIIDATEHDIVRYFNIEQFPTIIVVTGEKENLRIEGPFSKDEILAHLIEVYHLDKEALHPSIQSLS